MCTFKDERTVQVCDLTIGQVRQAVEESFGDLVRCTVMGSGGTLVQAESGLDSKAFGERVRAAIAAAQTASQ